MRFTFLRGKAYHIGICDKQHLLASASKLRLQHVNGKFKIQCFGRRCFSRAFIKGLKTCFELPRVKSYGNDRRGNKNYLGELAGGSS